MTGRAAGPLPEPDLPEEALSFERSSVEEAVYVETLDETIQALDREGIDYLFIGGIASAVLGRLRWSDDIDLLVRPQDARRVLQVLEEAGFGTQETDPNWLFKAVKRGVLIDVLFKSSGDIFLDEEMLARSRVETFLGRSVRIAPPEDLVVMKAVAHSEPTARYWHDALSILSHSDLDWAYLLTRARRGARRILSLLIYAQSNDLLIPDQVIRQLYGAIYESESAPQGDEDG